MVNLAQLLALPLFCFIGISLEAPQTPHPEYLRVKYVPTNEVKAILKKGLSTLNGAPVWQAPDNKSAEIHFTSKTYLGMTFKIWELTIIASNVEYKFSGPIHQKIVSPDKVTWLYKEEPFKILTVQQSDEKEYETLYPKSKPSKPLKDQTELEGSGSDSNVTQSAQPKISGPAYLTWKHANGSVVAAMKKSDEKQNGFPVWETPDKTVRVHYFLKEETHSWRIERNSAQMLLGPFQTIVSPDLVATWFSWDPKEQKWVPGKYLVEESNEDEYNNSYSQLVVQHPSVVHPQPEICPSVPEYVKIYRVLDNTYIAVMKKSDELKNQSPFWETPNNDPKNITIHLDRDPHGLFWVLSMNSKVALLGPGNGDPNQTCMASPHIVRWRTSNSNKQEWEEDARFLIQVSNEKEYKDIPQIARQPMVEGVVGEQSGLAGLPGLFNHPGVYLTNPQLAAIVAAGSFLSSTGVIGDVGSGASGLVKGVGGISSGVLDGVSKRAGGLFSSTGKLMNSGLSSIGLGRLDVIGGGLEHAWGEMGGAIGDVSHGMGQGINEITSGTSDGLNKIAGSMTDIFGGGSVLDGAEGIIGGVGSHLGGIARGAGPLTTGVAKGIGGLASGAIGGLGKTAGGLLSNTGDGLTSLLSTVGVRGGGTVLNHVGSGVTTVTRGLGGGIKKVFSGVGDFFG